MKNDEFRLLLESVALHWQQSAKAYADYMQNGKVFRFAEELKLHNRCSRTFMEGSATLIGWSVFKTAKL